MSDKNNENQLDRLSPEELFDRFSDDSGWRELPCDHPDPGGHRRKALLKIKINPRSVLSKHRAGIFTLRGHKRTQTAINCRKQPQAGIRL